MCGRRRPGSKLDLADWRRAAAKGLVLIDWERAVTNLLSDRRGVFVTLRLAAATRASPFWYQKLILSRPYIRDSLVARGFRERRNYPAGLQRVRYSCTPWAVRKSNYDWNKLSLQLKFWCESLHDNPLVNYSICLFPLAAMLSFCL